MVDIEAACDAPASRLEVIRRIRTLERIPPPPEEQQRLLAALADPEIELEVVADLVDRCPSVAARVMGVAGSAFFATGAPVRNVRDAVVRVLGLRLVADLVSCVALTAPLEVGLCPEFEPARYWMCAVATATLAQNLAADSRRMDARSRRSAYLCGLLHNFGVLVLVHLEPKVMSLIFREYRNGDGQFLAVFEQTYLGITHDEAGARLADSWGLPLEIGAVMVHHDRPEYQGEHWMQALLVGTAARLARALLRPDQEPVASTPGLEVLGLDSGRISQRLVQLADSMGALGEFAQQLK